MSEIIEVVQKQDLGSELITLFDLEFDIFMNLLKTEMTAKKIEHMLKTGKPLRG